MQGNGADNYDIVALTLDGTDMKPYWTGMAIYEDMFENELTITIDFVENRNFNEIQDFHGEEVLSLTYHSIYEPFHTDFEDFVHDFDVYKIERLKSRSQGNKVFRLHAVSIETSLNNKLLLSKSYKGKTTAEIVDDAFAFIGSDIEIVGAEEERNLFVVPNFTPYQLINYMAKTTMFGDMTDYVFFPDKEHFIFAPISELMARPVVEVLKMDQTSVSWEQDMNQVYKTIIMYHKDDTFDVLNDIPVGMNGSSMLGHNILTGLWERFDYENEESYNAKRHASPNNVHFYWGRNYDNREFLPDYLQSRYGKAAQHTNDRLVWQTNSNTNLRVGQVVELEIPTTRQFSMVQPAIARELDEKLSGPYLICRLKHGLDRTNANMTFEGIKIPEGAAGGSSGQVVELAKKGANLYIEYKTGGLVKDFF